jgi:3-phytase
MVALAAFAMTILAVPSMAHEDALPEPVIIAAEGETAESPGDGASGAAVWLHPADLSASLIVSGDDNAGLGVYTLDGAQHAFLTEDGGIGGVDVRYGFPLGSRTVSLIVGAVADEPRLVVYTVSDDDARTLIRLGAIETGAVLSSVCLFHSRTSGRFYAIAVNEDGVIEQYRLESEDGEWVGTLARRFEVGGETAGCAVDDALGRLYIGEEDAVLWRYGAEPEAGSTRAIVDVVSAGGGRFTEQVEGVALVLGRDRAQGYLIAANEQGDSFYVYERTGANAFVGVFGIGTGETAAGAPIDAVSEPGGLAGTALALGTLFPNGLFLSTDDVNTNPNEDANYKLVSWAAAADALGLPAFAPEDPRLAVTQTGQDAPGTDAVAVVASAETVPVPSQTDAADDPAIWVDVGDPLNSAVIGTDKTNGLVVYDLDGAVLQSLNVGRVNNVDLRQGFALADGTFAVVVAATNRTTGTLDLFRLDTDTRTLSSIAARPLVSSVEEVYGLCLYRSPIDDALYAFVNSADTGEVEQWLLSATPDGLIDADVVRTFTVGSQTEGCVADDARATLYIGEEARGIWRYGAEPTADETRVLVDATGADGNLTADTEGLAIYDGPTGQYLLASSQGSSTFTVYDLAFTDDAPNRYRGAFRVIENEAGPAGTRIDGVSGTDGLDVTAFGMGARYPAGLIVVQDDLNIAPDESQNFKYISWALVAEALGLE